jgi:hypothetical protein
MKIDKVLQLLMQIDKVLMQIKERAMQNNKS